MLNLLNRNNYVGAYLRLSKEDDNSEKESGSILNQKELIAKFCDENGFIIHDYYIDDGYSGGNFDRPAFNRLLKDIDKGIIDTVISKDTSRLGREFIDTSNYIFKYFPEHNVRYISILENFDTFKPNGMEDIIPFQTVINDMYLKDISRKIKSVRHQKMRDGLYVGSSVPYGYKRSEEDNRKFVVAEDEAEVVKRIYELRLDGKSTIEIAKILNNEQIQPPSIKHNINVKSSGLWHDSSVRKILNNEVYLGHLIQGKFDKISFKSKKTYLKPRSEWIIIKNNHEPIIDQETFDKVRKGFEELKNVRRTRIKHLLKGLVFCGECHKPMTFRTNVNKGVKTYSFDCITYMKSNKKKCSCHYYSEKKLQNYVFEELNNLLQNTIDNDKLSKKYDEVKNSLNKSADYNDIIKKSKERIKVLDKSLKDLYIDKNNEIISINDYDSLKQSFLDEKKELENTISDCEYKIGKTMIDNKNDPNKAELIKQFLNQPSISMLKALINKIEIYNDKTVKIFYKFKAGDKP